MLPPPVRLIALLLVHTFAFGQSITGTITGTVTDSSGAAVPGARVTIANTDTIYSLVFLTPGVTGTDGNSYGEMRYSVNGARQRTMDTLIDGVISLIMPAAVRWAASSAPSSAASSTVPSAGTAPSSWCPSKPCGNAALPLVSSPCPPS